MAGRTKIKKEGNVIRNEFVVRQVTELVIDHARSSSTIVALGMSLTELLFSYFSLSSKVVLLYLSTYSKTMFR